MLSHPREWMTNPGARCPPGLVLEQLTAPTPGVRHTLHRASALTEQLTDEVLDLALEPLRVLYLQTHVPPAGTSNRLGRLGLQRRVEAAHPGGRGGTVVNTPQPVHRTGPLVPAPTPLPPPDGLGAPPTEPVPHAPGAPGRAELPAAGPARPPAGAEARGAAAEAPAQQDHHCTAKGKRWRGRGRAGPHELRSGGPDGSLQAPRPGYHGAPAIQGNRPHGAGVHRRGRHHGTRGSVASAAAAPHPLPRHAAPPASRNAHADGTPHGGAAVRRHGGATGRRQGEFCPPPRPGADRGKHTRATAQHAPAMARHTPRAHRRQGRGWRRTPSWASAGGGAGAAGGGLPGHPARPRREYQSHILAGGRWTVWHGTARQKAFPPQPNVDWQQGPTQAYYMKADPWPLAVLLHTVSAPNKRQEPGWAHPPALVWSPDQEEHLQAARQGDAIRATDVPDLHAGPITHARPAATLAVAQRRQQNPQWVVCMFSPADAHIAVCDLERLPGPEAVVRVADCTRMIVKALQEGEHHTLLLQVRLKDNAKAANPGVWPAAAHPTDLELQLAVPTTVYHWLQAFHDLRWRGKPDRRFGATHWQEWLQADAQRDAIRSLGPAPATRALDAAAPGRALAPHTVPLANLPFDPAPEGAIRKSVPLPPARGATEPTKCPLCADKYYTSGAMLQHLAWHAVHAAAPVNDKEAASHILQGRAQRSPWHAPYARRPPLQVAGHAEGEGEAPRAAPGAGGAAQQGFIPAGLAPLPPLWGPLGTGAPHPMAPAHPGHLAAPADPAALLMRDS